MIFVGICILTLPLWLPAWVVAKLIMRWAGPRIARNIERQEEARQSTRRVRREELEVIDWTDEQTDFYGNAL